MCKYITSAATIFFCEGLNKVLEIAVVNEPSVFEPLKFYCIAIMSQKPKCPESSFEKF